MAVKSSRTKGRTARTGAAGKKRGVKARPARETSGRGSGGGAAAGVKQSRRGLRPGGPRQTAVAAKATRVSRVVSQTAKKAGMQKTGRRRTGGSEVIRAKGRGSGRKSVSLAGFPGLVRRDGCGVSLIVVERAGRNRERVTQVSEYSSISMKAGGGGRRARSPAEGATSRRASALSDACRALSTLGHVDRVRLMLKLLEGPATYRALQRTTRLKAGPLYHHINQLRLSGLLLPKQRDLYELTRGGRNLVLAAVVAAPLAKDGRRRPLG